ncbi:surfactin synthase thioesterase subunit [Nitrosospira sp. Nsp5]|uniref:Surfactin synthase thioesterase subunit n=1 Tax=Nitrosospira multiformis TaxID=1231 RepID=A0ABY0TCA9_9PROT|nr:MULTISPECIES: alpha/beta fold hydrolase [Nitrosospira]PTR05137.1 surfactin synthase thioesterase subunit [Nitrosospira sp. Nsp5]SDQ61242.1 Surfactin synthase thioesterase subunit [Nitrosospira multiformis]
MPAPLTLFSLPCAGASAAMYLRWRRRLPSWVRVQPIELPGRGERLHETPEKTFDALAARLCDELAMNPSQRYALFGHSMGALLAYRVAHCLRARMRPLPVALLVSACAAPSQQDWKRYADKDSDASLIAELRKQDGTPEEVFGNPELLSMTLGLLGADYRICASFRYQKFPPLPLPIHIFSGRADEIDVSKLEAWRLESAANCSLDWFEGGHFFPRLHEEAFLSTLAQRLAGDAAQLSDVPHAALASS